MGLCMLFTFENGVLLMRQEASVVWHHSLPLMNSFNKTEAAVFSCRLCFLRAFPFISSIIFRSQYTFANIKWKHGECARFFHANTCCFRYPLDLKRSSVWLVQYTCIHVLHHILFLLLRLYYCSYIVCKLFLPLFRQIVYFIHKTLFMYYITLYHNSACHSKQCLKYIFQVFTLVPVLCLIHKQKEYFFISSHRVLDISIKDQILTSFVCCYSVWWPH